MKKRWWITFIVACGVMIPFMAPYMTLNPDASRISVTSETLQYPVLLAHIGLAFAAMLTGFLQFVDRIRLQRPKLHRVIGRVYVGSVGASGLLALVLLFYIDDFTKAVAFLVLASLWLYTTWQGYRSAVCRAFPEHRVWMIRSMGITLVAVSARLLVPVLLLTYAVLNGFSLPGGRAGMVEAVLNVNIWAGIVLDLIIVEWFILRRKSGNVPNG